MRSRVNNEGGFSSLELGLILVVLLILIVVLIVQVGGVLGGSRAAVMETDISTVDTAVGQYILGHGGPPTADGRFPAEGEYALIDFGASFDLSGKTWTFHPDFLKKLPKHHDEGVWRMDNKSRVSVDIDPEDY